MSNLQFTMPTITLKPYERISCTVCNSLICNLYVSNAIPKALSKNYFPQRFYNVSNTLKVYTCSTLCQDQYCKFFETRVAKKINEEFGIDNDKLKQDHALSSISKCLLKTVAIKNKNKYDAMRKKICEIANINDDDLTIDLLQSFSSLKCETWKDVLLTKINTIDSAMRLISTVMTVIASQESYISEQLIKPTDSSNRTEKINKHNEKKIERKIRKYVNKKTKNGDKSKADETLSFHLKRKDAENKYRTTRNFSEYKTYLQSEQLRIEKTYETKLEKATTHDMKNGIFKHCDAEIQKLNKIINYETFRRKCFSEGRFWFWKKHILRNRPSSYQTKEKRKNLDDYVKYEEQIYPTLSFIEKDDCTGCTERVDCDDFIPFNNDSDDCAINPMKRKYNDYVDTIVQKSKQKRYFEA